MAAAFLLYVYLNVVGGPESGDLLAASGLEGGGALGHVLGLKTGENRVNTVVCRLKIG